MPSVRFGYETRAKNNATFAFEYRVFPEFSNLFCHGYSSEVLNQNNIRAIIFLPVLGHVAITWFLLFGKMLCHMMYQVEPGDINLNLKSHCGALLAHVLRRSE